MMSSRVAGRLFNASGWERQIILSLIGFFILDSIRGAPSALHSKLVQFDRLKIILSPLHLYFGQQ
jgi:hypothetical protein